MAQIILHRSPFGTGTTDHAEHNGALIDWLQDHYPHGFGVPIKVTLNGSPLPLENLDIHLLQSDVVEITVQPAGPAVVGYLIQAVVALAISYVVTRVFGPKPPKNPAYSETPQPSPIYSVAVAQNATRLGEAIPVIYGEVMTTPDYASQPYLAYTEVPLVDSTSPPGYTIDYMDVSWNIISTTTTAWPQGYLFFESFTGDWAAFPTGSASPGLVEGSALATPGLYSDEWAFSPNTDPEDGAAIRIDLTMPPGAVFARISNNQSTVASVIEREAGNNGDQYLCALMCVGCGEFENVEPEDIRIGNTTLDLLDTSTYTAGVIGRAIHAESIGPISFLMALASPTPDTPTYWENCITALEVGDQELIDAGDETLYFPVGDREVFRILLDIAFPRGLYVIDSGGSFLTISVQIEISVQIKSAGVWQDYQIRTVTFTNAFAADVSPWRRSLSMAVSPGIYRVKIRRITAAAPTTGTASDAFTWIGLRGFIATPVENNYAYGDTSLFALRLRANNLISENGTSRIQVKARRLLPGVGFTTSPSYFVRDIMENTDYGARRPPGVDVDWPLFSALDARWGGAARFNGGFTERVTVWDALSAVLIPGVAEPILIGGQVSARYEGLRYSIVQLFTDANIVQGSLSISYTFQRVGETDGFTVDWRNPTNWQPEFVTYPVDAVNPEKAGTFGLADPFNAFLYARFLHQRRQYTRKRIKFDVELEGNLPAPGDLIGVQQTLIKPSSGGRVVSYNTATNQMVLEVPVSLPPGPTYAIVLRDRYGEPTTGYLVSPVSETVVTLSVDPSIPIEDINGDSPTLYAIGELSDVVSYWLVDSVSPSGSVTFTIDASNYDTRIYADTFPFFAIEV